MYGSTEVARWLGGVGEPWEDSIIFEKPDVKIRLFFLKQIHVFFMFLCCQNVADTCLHAVFKFPGFTIFKS